MLEKTEGTTQSRIVNPETREKLGTQDAERRSTRHRKPKMSNQKPGVNQCAKKSLKIPKG